MTESELIDQLVEACESAITALGESDLKSFGAMKVHALIKLRAAIAKARGEA